VNASELYEIVKDLPPEAKPNDMAYCTPLSGREGWWTPDHDGESVAKVSPALAEAAFVGSMVLHLISEGYHDFEWSGDSDEGTVTLTLYDQQFTATTELGCLAAACKGARP
jgi:hypothetical protein